MRKWMVEFLRKFENCAIKSGRDNAILITKIYKFTVIYFNFVRCWGYVSMLTSLSQQLLLSLFIEKYMVKYITHKYLFHIYC